MTHNRGLLAHETPLVVPGNKKGKALVVDVVSIGKRFVRPRLRVVTINMHIRIDNSDLKKGRPLRPLPPCVIFGLSVDLIALECTMQLLASWCCCLLMLRVVC